MKLFGIASKLSNDADDWYASREEAEAVLVEVLADEPDLEGVVYVAEIDLPVGEN